MEFILGIDIGAKGAISAICFEKNKTYIQTYGFDEVETPKNICGLMEYHTITHVFIEEPLVFAGKAVLSMAALCKHYGYWTGWFEAHGVKEIHGIKVSEWKKQFNITKKDEKSVGYNKLLSFGWPEDRFFRYGKTGKQLRGFHDGKVDATLIALCGANKYGLIKTLDFNSKV